MMPLFVLLVSLHVVLYVESTDVQHLTTGVSFLTKYGYMDPPDPNAAALMSEIEVRQSIMKMQRFLHLPQTGQMDDATWSMMQRPRCGLPDMPQSGQYYGSRNARERSRRYLTQGVRWEKNDLTYSFDNYTPDMSRAQTRDSIERAMKTWSDVTPLRFREIQGGNPDIHIQFSPRVHGDDYAFDGEGGTLAHAFFPGYGLGGDAHFDEAESFTFNTYAGTNLFTVAAHEFGHSLGLGHSDVPGALMAPYYQGYDPDFSLPYDDIAGIQSLYGSNPRPQPSPKPRPTYPPVEPEPTPSPTCTGGFSAVSDIRGEVFIFKADEMWRLSSAGTPLSGYPMPTSRFWEHAPSGADAVFEKVDGTIVFVKDFEYWEFNGLDLKSGFPQYLRSLTEGELTSVDAVFSLRREAKTYYFKDAYCWRFDGMREPGEQLDEGYPKLITEEWVGGPATVDAAFSFDGNAYLVQGNRYWQFTDGTLTAGAEPRWLTVDFLGCSEDTVVITDDDDDEVGGGDRRGAAFRTVSGLWMCLLSALAALLLFR